MFTFTGTFDPTNIFAAQLQQIGINQHSLSLPFDVLMHNINEYKGSEFVQTRFKEGKDKHTALENILRVNMLRKKTIDEQCNNVQFKDALNQVKLSNWPFSVLETKFHMGQELLKYCSEVKIGKFPRDYPDITPEHNIYPPTDMHNDTLIFLRKKQMEGTLKGFDVLYHTNRITHMYSDVLSGACCNSMKIPGAADYAPHIPGCWWIRESTFYEATGLDCENTLTPESIMQGIWKLYIEHQSIKPFITGEFILPPPVSSEKFSPNKKARY
eukprot:CAMPEP_0172157106 /NCGR_PEP_ID=MMETSP1050-20130122/3598_1 /TAXON_ID=233186 /ORGANISM="Cryptomonas curvata, Strain CCAP979/52" /LENGTH=269 /DNA_ID=CAMNT_0012826281 /DNA_START=831 /DNA_END=1640 /DNA_ORIENTATION=-